MSHDGSSDPQGYAELEEQQRVLIQRPCYDCEQNPCICGDIFPMSRIREGDKIYDHNGGLLVDLAVEREMAAIVAPAPRTHCQVCGTRLRNTRTQVLGECRRCHK